MEWLEQIEFWHWWVLAVLLMAVEVFAPTTLFLWTGISAAAVGFIVLFARGIGWEVQVLLFAVLSVASVLGWRQYARLRPATSDDPLLSRRGEQRIGRLFSLEEPIVNGRGRVKVDGIFWKIEGDDLEAGNRVKVVGTDGVILKVEEA